MDTKTPNAPNMPLPGFHKRGRFEVHIADDGAIHVKSGDWLSKYSVALYNDFTHVREFGRKDRYGIVEPVADVNKIRAGEILYHIPTHKAWINRRSQTIRDPMSIFKTGTHEQILSYEQKKKLVEELLSKDHNLRGANLEILSKAIDILGKVDDALTLLEIASLIGEGGIISAVGTTVSMATVIAFPISATISLVNAAEGNMRTAGMRSVAYATTAWAFSEEPPQTSKVITNITTTYERDNAQKAWLDALKETKKVLENEVAKRQIQKQSMQIALQAVGMGFSHELCMVLLKSFEQQLSGTHLVTWKQNYNILYPD